MQKIAFVVSYEGTSYAGFQRQPNVPTVQGELEGALRSISKQDTPIIGSGRTDAGVHAYGQVIHFSTTLTIPTEKWPLAIKSYLPPDIVVRSAYLVTDDFHARYDATGKMYTYTIDRSRIPNVFWRRYAYHVPIPLDLDKISKALPQLEGTHDFTAFSASGSTVENRVRTIYGIKIEEKGSLLTFTFHGNGFLYNMVRILVGTLIEIGQGKIDPDSISHILQSQDRTLAGSTVPPQGLCLKRVEYPAEKLLYFEEQVSELF